MSFDGRGRKQGSKKCIDFHSWKDIKSTVENETLYYYQKCKDCTIERKQFIRKVK